MSFEDINSIGQTVAIIATVASLIFVGYQIRQNTRAQVHQQVADAFTVYLENMANHSAIVHAGTSGKDTMASLTDEELLRFSFIMAGLFKIWENAFYQHKNGFLDERSWQSNVTWMLTWFHLPGVQTWWQVRKDLFAAEYGAFLESSPSPGARPSIPARLREAAQAS